MTTIPSDPPRVSSLDPARQTAWGQAGLTWEEFDRETLAFGLATTGGGCGSTGLAGVALGGGVGWLVRKFGATCDNILAIDVVTADGTSLTATAIEYPE